MDTPTSIDLTQFAGTVALQGNENTCAENALYNCLLMQTNMAGSSFKIDRQLAYQNVLNVQGNPNTDQGTYIPNMFSTAETKGLNADTGVYGHQYIGTQPTSAQVTEATTHKITSTSTLDLITQTSVTVAEIVDLLNQNTPVILGFNLRQGFVNGTGVNSGALLGGHAVEVVGYRAVTGSDGQQHDILKVASWGPSYGLNGYFDLDMTASFGTADSHRDILSVDAINGFNGVNWSADQNAINTAELYNSLLQRSPETSAFINMGNALKSGLSMSAAANNLLASQEIQSLLPQSASNSQVVSYFYAHIQGRTNPDAEGVTYWTNYLNNGGDRGVLAAQMIHDTQDSSQWAWNYWAGTNPVLRTASDWLYNRAEVSIDISLHMQDTADTQAHGALLTTVLNNVTADPNSVQAALIGVSSQLGHTIIA